MPVGDVYTYHGVELGIVKYEVLDTSPRHHDVYRCWGCGNNIQTEEKFVERGIYLMTTRKTLVVHWHAACAANLAHRDLYNDSSPCWIPFPF